MARPIVTALIDTYNHGRFIEQAIESVLSQELSAEELEVIVVDDGSTDDTAERVRKFGGRVRYLRKPNGGQASAFNVGIPEARGKIVAFLDGDDWWTENKLRVVLDVLEKHPDAGAVGHGFFEVDGEGRPFGTVVPERAERLGMRSPEEARLFDQLKGFLGTSKVAIRKSVLDRILPVPEELVIEADEYLFTLAVALSGAIVLNQPLFHYRFHGNNLFMVGSYDEARLRRRHHVLAKLLDVLPGKLREFGVPDGAISAALASLRLEVDYQRLQLEGGWPWEMFRVEREAARLAYSRMGFGYRVFKTFVLGLTLVTPPRRFCQLKRWYAARGLRKIRRLAGEPTQATPVTVRRATT